MDFLFDAFYMQPNAIRWIFGGEALPISISFETRMNVNSFQDRKYVIPFKALSTYQPKN